MVETWLRWMTYIERKSVDYVEKRIDHNHMDGSQITCDRGILTKL